MESVVTFLQDVVPQVTFPLVITAGLNSQCPNFLTTLLILVQTTCPECVFVSIIKRGQHQICTSNKVRIHTEEHRLVVCV